LPRYHAAVAEKAPEVVGNYLVYEQLGRGGMATVHRAETQGVEGFRRPVALKRLHPNLAADNDLVKSFVHEARLASHLRHANCAQTYDLGKVDGTYFIAMEYVPGATLMQIVRQCNAAAGLMPIPIALNILIQVLDGLDHAHNLSDESGRPLGIIHRDVSPSNVIVSNTGVVKLIDFGIAKAESMGAARTQTGLIKGKFGYVAPEYTYGQLDLRADLFAVGVIAHEILTGKRLFEGKDNFETLEMLRSGPIQPPSRYRPDVARDFDDIVMTALQRDPAQRWQSAVAMRTALANYAREQKLEVTNQQVFEWVEWAFMQETRDEDTKLVRAILTLSEGSTGTRKLSPRERESLDEHAQTILRDSHDEAKTIVRESAMYSAQTVDDDTPPPSTKLIVPVPPLKTAKIDRRTNWVAWIVFLLALGAIGWIITDAAMDHYGYEWDL
jgi:serine/threonine-protein kinase